MPNLQFISWWCDGQWWFLMVSDFMLWLRLASRTAKGRFSVFFIVGGWIIETIRSKHMQHGMAWHDVVAEGDDRHCTGEDSVTGVTSLPYALYLKKLLVSLNVFQYLLKVFQYFSISFNSRPLARLRKQDRALGAKFGGRDQWVTARDPRLFRFFRVASTRKVPYPQEHFQSTSRLEFGWFQVRVFQACSHNFQKESGIKRRNIMKYQWLWSYSMLFVQFLTFGFPVSMAPLLSISACQGIQQRSPARSGDAQDWTNLNQSNNHQ